MADTSIVFEENIAPTVAAQQARGLADCLRTCIGLVPTSPAPQHLHDEQRPSSRWHDSQGPEVDVRRHFRDAVKHIMRQPHGADFVLCPVGRMAEDILSIVENAEQDSQFASEWFEYARWVLAWFQPYRPVVSSSRWGRS
jgi:hypothetical protein